VRICANPDNPARSSASSEDEEREVADARKTIETANKEETRTGAARTRQPARLLGNRTNPAGQQRSCSSTGTPLKVSWPDRPLRRYGPPREVPARRSVPQSNVPAPPSPDMLARLAQFPSQEAFVDAEIERLTALDDSPPRCWAPYPVPSAAGPLWPPVWTTRPPWHYDADQSWNSPHPDYPFQPLVPERPQNLTESALASLNRLVAQANIHVNEAWERDIARE